MIYQCDWRNCSKSVHSLAASGMYDTIRVGECSRQSAQGEWLCSFLSCSLFIVIINPCAEGTGGCSDICVLIPGEPRRACLCPIGIGLLSDGRTCNKDGENPLSITVILYLSGINGALLVAASSGVFFMSLDTTEHIPMQLEKSFGDGRVVDVDYDEIEGFCLLD